MKTVLIKTYINGATWAYKPNDKIEMEDKRADNYISAGYAVLYEPEPVTVPEPVEPVTVPELEAPTAEPEAEVKPKAKKKKVPDDQV